MMRLTSECEASQKQEVECTLAWACSSLSVGTTMTLSPCFQFTGVATECFAVSCSESTTRRI